MEVSEDSSVQLPHCTIVKREAATGQSLDETSHSSHSTVHYVQSVSNPKIIKMDMLSPGKQNLTSTTSFHQSIPSIHANCSNDPESYDTLDYVDSPVVSIQDDPQAHQDEARSHS